MQVAVLDKTIPLRNIPEDSLNKIIAVDLARWLCSLLSLTDENSANKLEAALPAIKDHCWSMGFAEIKKMFEMYADSKLSVKPISNHLDRVLVGQIHEAYKSQKKIVKQPEKPLELSSQDIEINQILNIFYCYDEWKETKTISLSYSGVFDRFIEKGIIKDPKAPKYQKYLAKKMQGAKEMLIKGYEVQEQREYASKNAIREIIKEVKSGLSPKIEEKAKCLVLEDYFSKIEKEGLDFKEILSKHWNTEVVKDSKYDL